MVPRAHVAVLSRYPGMLMSYLPAAHGFRALSEWFVCPERNNIPDLLYCRRRRRRPRLQNE